MRSDVGRERFAHEAGGDGLVDRCSLRPFVALDVSAAADAATGRKTVDPDLVGPALIAGATVLAERDGSLTIVAVLESADGRRTVAQSRDQALGAAILADDPVGMDVTLVSPGEFAPA
jgi:hypothetical protein